jgi:tRNA (guanine-N7-)-methyltransferase
MTYKCTESDVSFSFDPWGPGNILIRLRNGEAIEIDPYNRYLHEAMHLTDLLHTRPELEGGFPGIFENPSLPVLLEIGCYMGETVAEISKRNQDINILGVDIKYKRVVKSCLRIKREKLSNAKIAISDARELLTILPDHSLLGILAFFPDPWQKLKHEKHRFLSDYFFNTALRKLTDRGFIWIKTDNHAYFEEVKTKVPGFDFTITDSLPLSRHLVGENYRTFFEQLFVKLKKPIYQLFLQKANKS